MPDHCNAQGAGLSEPSSEAEWRRGGTALSGLIEEPDLHVCHVVRQFSPSVGGLEDAVANLAAELARTPGVTTSVLTLDRVFTDRSKRLAPVDEHLGVPIRRIPFLGSKRYPLAPSVLKHVERADLVHVHGIDFFFDFLSATRGLHRKPLVASTHGGFFHTSFASRLKDAYFKTVTKHSARGYRRIFGSSENDTKTFRQIAGKQTETIENGVNVRKWYHAGSETPVPVMLYVGRFSSNKDIPALIDLLAAIKARCSGWRLIIAGQPSDVSVDALKQIASKLNVSNDVNIVVGPTDEEMKGLIARASFIVSASRYEGFGITIVEGMSAGLVPYVSNIPPFERLVSTTGCGRTFEVLDLGTAAENLLDLHRGATLSGGHERASCIAAANRYAWADPAARFATAYREVMAETA